MDRGRLILAAAAVVMLAAVVWLYRDNQQLQDELAELRAAGAGAEAAQVDDAAAEGDAELSVEDAEEAGRTARAALRKLGERASRDRPELPEPEKDEKPSRLERRLRFEERVRSYLGRRPGETAQEYRDRVLPLMEVALSRPRARVNEAWDKARAAADLSDDQQAELDEVFGDAQAELIEMTNRAVAEGDLTPYERNWSGLLDYAGGMGMLLDQTEQRIGGILSPEQLGAIYGTGFEWGEYLGVTAPWENLNPPPPPGGPGAGG